jgi:hypothetical protein
MPQSVQSQQKTDPAKKGLPILTTGSSKRKVKRLIIKEKVMVALGAEVR